MTVVDAATESGAAGAGEAWPHRADLRGWLALLAGRGELKRLRREIDPDQEVAAVLERVDGQHAVRFDAVRGASLPLVGNTVSTRGHFALAMGCAEGELGERVASAIRSPRACRHVDPADAPVLAERTDGGDLLGDLPLPIQHEHDAGRYLTSALVVARDPRTGAVNLSINRMQVTGPAEVRVLMLPGRLREIFAAHEAEGEDLQVGLCLGVDPLLALASQSPASPGLDDLEVASALHPEPLAVTTVEGLDAPVPAAAEMLLVGSVRCGARAPEGPFGEFPLTYGPGGPAPVIDLSTRWSRPEPVMQTILSGGREHFWLGGLPREARLAEALRAAGVDVAGVRLTEGGSCRLHVVVAVRGARPGIARHAAMAAFTAVSSVKLAVVVDDDIDIVDDEQVGWAVATRMQADRDVSVIPSTVGSSLDPSAGDGVTAKLVVDATAPDGGGGRFARMRSAPVDAVALDTYLAELEDTDGIR